MKKTCRALVIGLLITTNAFAKEVPVKHNNSCLRVVNSAFMMKALQTNKEWRFIDYDFSRLVANQKDCEFIADLILASYNLSSAKTLEPTTQTVNTCGQVESELSECKKQLQDAEFEGERRGFYRGQMQR